MTKKSTGAPSILNAIKDIKKNKLLPIYYFIGEDSFSISNALSEIEEASKKFITSDFDKEYIYGEDKNLRDVLDYALAFPFGSEKKLIIFKEFEKVKDKKALASYTASPPEFTIIVFIHNGSVSSIAAEPFKSLNEKGFLYEAKELKGKNLLEWLCSYCESKGKFLSQENAQVLLDISGDNRTLLESQLEKIFAYSGESNEITLEAIKSLSTSLKEYTIFDLQNALGKKNKQNSLKVSFNMLEKGAEPTFIIHMLTRYFTGLLRINELKEKKIPEPNAARIVGTHPYYYKDYLAARMRYSDKEITNAASALLKADLSVKTTSMDNKSIISILIAEILQ